MAHFAKLNEQNIVTEVIVADDISWVEQTFPGRWLQTSYNTYGGVHSSGGEPFRKNYAGLGFSYDEARDAFIPPQPFPSWTLNEDTCLWDSPVPYPQVDGKIFSWSEELQLWQESNLN